MPFRELSPIRWWFTLIFSDYFMNKCNHCPCWFHFRICILGLLLYKLLPSRNDCFQLSLLEGLQRVNGSNVRVINKFIGNWPRLKICINPEENSTWIHSCYITKLSCITWASLQLVRLVHLCWFTPFFSAGFVCCKWQALAYQFMSDFCGHFVGRKQELWRRFVRVWEDDSTWLERSEVDQGNIYPSPS